MDKWWEQYITQDEHGWYIAWDETQYDSIAYCETKAEAIKAVIEYAKYINKDIKNG
jgi:hypothetical protein